MRLEGIAVLATLLLTPSVHAWEIDGHKEIADSALKTLQKSEKNHFLELKRFQDLIDQGVQDEDNSDNWKNHFYDPSLEIPNLEFAVHTGIGFYTVTFPSDAVTQAQRRFANATGSYAENDKPGAYRYFGRMLHLAAGDLTQPQHVHNDPHAPRVTFLGLDVVGDGDDIFLENFFSAHPEIASVSDSPINAPITAPLTEQKIANFAHLVARETFLATIYTAEIPSDPGTGSRFTFTQLKEYGIEGPLEARFIPGNQDESDPNLRLDHWEIVGNQIDLFYYIRFIGMDVLNSIGGTPIMRQDWWELYPRVEDLLGGNKFYFDKIGLIRKAADEVTLVERYVRDLVPKSVAYTAGAMRELARTFESLPPTITIRRHTAQGNIINQGDTADSKIYVEAKDPTSSEFPVASGIYAMELTNLDTSEVIRPKMATEGENPAIRTFGNLADGRYKLEVWDGLTGDSAITFTVDTDRTAPRIVEVRDSNGTVEQGAISAGKVVTINALDDPDGGSNSGLGRIVVQSGSMSSGSVNEEDKGQSYTYRSDDTNLGILADIPAGPVSIQVFDKSGNESNLFSFVVKKPLPTTTSIDVLGISASRLGLGDWSISLNLRAFDSEGVQYFDVERNLFPTTVLAGYQPPGAPDEFKPSPPPFSLNETGGVKLRTTNSSGITGFRFLSFNTQTHGVSIAGPYVFGDPQSTESATPVKVDYAVPGTGQAGGSLPSPASCWAKNGERITYTPDRPFLGDPAPIPVGKIRYELGTGDDPTHLQYQFLAETEVVVGGSTESVPVPNLPTGRYIKLRATVESYGKYLYDGVEQYCPGEMISCTGSNNETGLCCSVARADRTWYRQVSVAACGSIESSSLRTAAGNSPPGQNLTIEEAWGGKFTIPQVADVSPWEQAVSHFEVIDHLQPIEHFTSAMPHKAVRLNTSATVTGPLHITLPIPPNIPEDLKSSLTLHTISGTEPSAIVVNTPGGTVTADIAFNGTGEIGRYALVYPADTTPPEAVADLTGEAAGDPASADGAAIVLVFTSAADSYSGNAFAYDVVLTREGEPFATRSVAASPAGLRQDISFTGLPYGRYEARLVTRDAVGLVSAPATVAVAVPYSQRSFVLVDGNPEALFSAAQSATFELLAPGSSGSTDFIQRATGQGLTILSNTYSVHTPGGTFSPAGTLIIRFSESALINEHLMAPTLKVYETDPNGGLFLPPQTYDPVRHEFRVTLNTVFSVFAIAGVKAAPVDTLPPVTNLSFNGPSSGSNGSFTISTYTAVALTAVDPLTVDVASSGVAAIRYLLDTPFQNPNDTPGVTYTAPFNLPVGGHSLAYYAVDHAGNVESAHSAFIAVSASTTTPNPGGGGGDPGPGGGGGGNQGTATPGPISLIARTDTALRIMWGTSTNSPETQYSVAWGTAPAYSCEAFGQFTGGMQGVGSSATITGLEPGTNYNLSVCNFSANPSCSANIIAATTLSGSEDNPPYLDCGGPGGGGGDPGGGGGGGGNGQGLAVAADPQGRLWIVAEDEGAIIVGRYDASGAFQKRKELGPRGESDGAWNIRFDAFGNGYVVGTGEGIVVYKLDPELTPISSATFVGGAAGKATAWDASGDIWITGILQQGSFEDGSVNLQMGLWKYCFHSGLLSLTTTYTRGGPADAGFGVRAVGGKVYVEGYTTTTPLQTPSLGAALWVFDNQGHGPIAGPFIKPDYLRSLEGDVNAKLETLGGTLFASLQRTGPTGQSDLALVRYEASGREILERYATMGPDVSLSPRSMTVAPDGKLVVGVQARVRQEDGSTDRACGIVRYDAQGSFIDVSIDERTRGGLSGIAYLGQDLWLAIEGSTVPHKFRVDQVLPAVDVFVSSSPVTPPAPQDTTAPVTTLSLNGAPVSAGPIAASPADVFGLSATDSGQDASGVAATRLNVDGAGYAAYVSTFTLAAGAHTVSFYSVDAAGNAETEKSVAVNVVAPVSASLTLNPDTINLKSNGNSISAVLEFTGIDAALVNPATLRLSRVNGQAVTPLVPLAKPAPKLGDSDEDGVPDWTMKFDRQALIALLPAQEQVELTLEGAFTAGSHFTASAFVRTISPSVAKANANNSVVHPASGAGVALPKGALAKDTEISVMAVGAEPEAQKEAKENAAEVLAKTPIGKPVDFGPEGSQFSVPVTITLPYDPGELKGAGPDKLQIAYWNPKTSAWEPLPSVVDPQKRVVVAQTTHFSQYQVLSPPPTGGSGPAAAPAAASDAFGLVDVYAFPNPARGKNPTIRVQTGAADSVQLRFYDVSGAQVSEASLNSWRLVDDGNGKGSIPTFDHVFDVSGVGSGVYIYTVTAKKNGSGDLRTTKRVAVIK